MYRFNAERTGNSLRGDHVLSASVLLLAGVGLMTLYSSSYAFAEHFFNDSFYFISRQILLGAIGIVLFFIASRVNLEFVRKLIKPLIAVTVFLCILTFIPGVGVSRNGASRWFRIGPWTYQP